MNVREKASRRADEAFRNRNFNAADAVRDAALRLKRVCSALKCFGKLERLNEAFRRRLAGAYALRALSCEDALS